MRFCRFVKESGGLLIYILSGNKFVLVTYVVIKQKWGRFRYTPVEKPESPSRWYYDDRNDTYLRIKTWMGMSIRMIGPKHKAG